MDKNQILYETVVERSHYPMSGGMINALVVCLLVIVLAILVCILAKSSEPIIIAIVPGIIIIAIVGIWGFLNVLALTSGIIEYKEVNLSSVHADIIVDGDKVTIDNLPDKYYYQDKVNEMHETGTKPTHISRRVFKYDGFYDTKKLIDENGVEFKLNDADKQFLKERGVK